MSEQLHVLPFPTRLISFFNVLQESTWFCILYNLNYIHAMFLTYIFLATGLKFHTNCAWNV